MRAVEVGIDAQLEVIRAQTTDEATALIDDGDVGLNQLGFDANNVVRLRQQLLRTQEHEQAKNGNSTHLSEESSMIERIVGAALRGRPWF